MYIRRIKVSKSWVPLLFKSLLYESSICTTCCHFLFQHNTTQVKRTSHAMQKYLSLQQHRCLLPAAPQAEVAGGWGPAVPQCFPHSHMLVSQVGDRLPSPGIRWMSDLNMWLSTLSPLWLLSSFNSSSAPAAAWVQF